MSSALTIRRRPLSDEAWARGKKMESYLSVNAGSAVPAVFLEVTVEPEKPSDLPPIVLVGKGVCFDTGGISIKPSAKMDAMFVTFLLAPRPTGYCSGLL